MTEHLVICGHRITNRALVLVIITSIPIAFLFILSSPPYLPKNFMLKSNTDGNSSSKTSVRSPSLALCFLIRVHSGHLPYLTVTALALNHTGFDKIHLYVVSIDKNTDKQSLSHTINTINTMVERENYISLLDVGSFAVDAFGYSPMDHALTYLYKQYEHSPSACDYIILTNGDNLYSRHLGKHMLPHIHAKKDVIAWNFISKYHLADIREVRGGKEAIVAEITDTGTEKCIPVALQVGAVDLGSAGFRLAFLKQHHHHMHYPDGNYDGISDGHFIRTAASLTNNSVILRQTLFIHQ